MTIREGEIHAGRPFPVRARRRFGDGASVAATLDVEKDLGGYEPQAPRPRPDDLRQAVQVPDVPQEWPLVERLLTQWLNEPLVRSAG